LGHKLHEHVVDYSSNKVKYIFLWKGNNSTLKERHCCCS